MRKSVFSIILLDGIVLFAGMAAATERHVPSGYATIQAAINACNNGDVVIVAPGTYTGTGNRDIDFLGKAITVRSTDPNDPNIIAATIIDCNSTVANPHRGFIFAGGEDANSILSGFTITNAYYTGHGGGIYCNGSGPAISYCTISNCVANNPNNMYYEHGGGIYGTGSNPIVSHCTITQNLANVGGAIYCTYQSNLTIDNCIIADNTASYAGGGIGFYDSGATISHCTIAGNSASEDGGIHGSYNGYILIDHCILWGNSNGQISGNHVTVSYCDVEGGYAGTGNINSDPFFLNPAGGDYHISSSSPCIDAGDPNYAVGPGEVDIDGDPRVVNLRIDIGADEYTTGGPSVIEITPEQFTFIAEEGGPNPPPQVLYVSNVGEGQLNWTVIPECNWLSAEPNTGTATDEPNEIELIVDINNLTHGIYHCTLLVSDPCASNSPQTATITLYINIQLLVPSEYNTIQSAIDAALNGDTVLVADGVYTGPGNRDIDFLGKEITVKSENGPENCIINCQGDADNPRRGFYFHGGETSSSVLGGLTITGGYVFDCGGSDYGGAGIFCSDSSPTIINCIITGNHTELIPGCLGGCFGGGIKIWGSSSPTFTNCIISNNSMGMFGNGSGIYGPAIVKNSIIWANTGANQIEGGANVSYSDVQGGFAGTGNINADPLFANPSGDYHLKSQAGRWNPDTETWVMDAGTSPCIDAGDPNSDWTAELWPHGKRINIGAYGGTPEASMSLSTAGNIANLDNDPCDIVDFNDLALFVGKWLEEEVLLAEDLDRNGVVNFVDYAIFAQQWLLYSPAEPGIKYRISPCEGRGLSATERLDETRFTVTVVGRYIHFEDMMVANCCPKELWLEMTIEDNLITVVENEWGGVCFCICDYPVTATLGPFEPGTYTLEVYNGGFIGSVTVTIE